MLTRRQFLARTGLTLCGASSVLAAPSETRDQIPDGSASRDMITPQAEEAIAGGLAYLSANQSFGGTFGTGRHFGGNVAITSLAALAFMAGGHFPGRGKYGRNVTNALNAVLDTADHRGFLRNPRLTMDYAPMYSHGFGTLFLGE